jgi:hypothetical protein
MRTSASALRGSAPGVMGAAGVPRGRAPFVGPAKRCKVATAAVAFLAACTSGGDVADGSSTSGASVATATASNPTLAPSPTRPHYAAVSVFDLAANPAAFDGRPIEMVDALTGWGDEYSALDLPLWISLRPDRTFCKTGVAATRSLDLRQVQGVYHAGTPPNGPWLSVHAVTDAPDTKDYQVIDRKVLDRDPGRWDRRRIEYVGAWATAYEGSYLDTILHEGFPVKGVDAIWLGSVLDSDAQRSVARVRAAKEASGGRPPLVRARGRIYTRRGGYGHMGGSRYLVVAEQLDFL